MSFYVQHYCKSNQPILQKLDAMIGPTSRKNWLTFGGDPLSLLSPLRNRQEFLIQSRSIFTTLRNDWHWQVVERLCFLVAEYCTAVWSCSAHTDLVSELCATELCVTTHSSNPQHFGSDLADIWIRIRINPEIYMYIGIPDHLFKVLYCIPSVDMSLCSEAALVEAAWTLTNDLGNWFISSFYKCSQLQ